jgi:HAD superfamily hydrolase (TIGR01509 family)
VKTPGIIFDLDGTLIDSVYQHVSTWNQTLRDARITVPQWRIHRAIGMGGSLFLPKLLRDEGLRHSPKLIERLESTHQKHFDRFIGRIDPLPGATQLLRHLEKRSIPFAIATSGSAGQTKRLLARIPNRPDCPILTADDVQAAKPAPDLFQLAAQKLDREPGDCFVVGDSVWDVLAARRLKSAAIALRTGGFDAHELQESGAYRVYADPRELHDSLEQLGLSAWLLRRITAQTGNATSKVEFAVKPNKSSPSTIFARSKRWVPKIGLHPLAVTTLSPAGGSRCCRGGVHSARPQHEQQMLAKPLMLQRIALNMDCDAGRRLYGRSLSPVSNTKHITSSASQTHSNSHPPHP